MMKTYRLCVNANLDVRANSLAEAMECVRKLEGRRKLVVLNNSTDDTMLLGCESVEDAIANYGENAFEV